MKSSSRPTIETARSGDATVRVNSRYLYSRYDPRRETDRFVEAKVRAFYESVAHYPACVIVISEGLGYIEDACSRMLPECDLVSIHLTTNLSSTSARKATHTLALEGDAGIAARSSARSFSESRIEALISQLDISQILVVEWEPSVVTFTREYDIVRHAIERVLRRRAADTATVRRWGRLWIRNTLRNCARGPLAAQLPSFNRWPSLVICPGPSALATVESLADAPRRPVIIAVSSALELLNSFGIPPDLIVHTDAGFYSTLHFRNAWNTLCNLQPSFRLVMPLTAAPPPIPVNANTCTTTVVSGNSQVEQAALRAAGLNARIVPEAGTVTTTALRIASLISKGPRFVSGLDLCFDDIRHHSSPHAFDAFLSVGSDRFNPEVTTRLTRAMDTHPESGSRIRRADNLELYAEWFRGRNEEFAAVRRVNPSEVDTGMQPATVSQLLETVNSAESDDLAIGTSWSREPSPGAAKRPAVSREEIVTELLTAAGVHQSGEKNTSFRKELARWLNVDDDSTAIRGALSSLYDLPGNDPEAV